MNPQAKACSHLVIGRDGSITQMVPFDQLANHAGPSFWHGYSGLNRFSIGIELDNPGKLKRSLDGGWQTSFDRKVKNEDVHIAKHKHEPFETGWHTYTQEQIQATIDISLLLHQKYNFHDIVGHDDISPNRKVDPGPAFPMESFRSKVMGRNQNETQIFKTTTTLNIRSGPGLDNRVLEEGPLPPNTKVDILDENHLTWVLVDVLDPINGISGIQGWVHGRYLAEV